MPAQACRSAELPRKKRKRERKREKGKEEEKKKKKATIFCKFGHRLELRNVKPAHTPRNSLHLLPKGWERGGKGGRGIWP